MWKTVAIIIIMFCVFSSASYCQDIEIGGKGGIFYLTSTDKEFTEYWASTGYLVGGRVSLVLKNGNVISLDIEDLKTSRSFTNSYGDTYIKTQAHNMAVYLSYQKRASVST